MLLERMGSVLSKVKISGGGRCNVTNACFDPADLVMHYPRGRQALRGPFSRFQPRDTVEWFESRGAKLKTEPDHRVFPVSDSSQTIIDTLQQAAQKAGVEVRVNTLISEIQKARGGGFQIKLPAGWIQAARVILATGSSPQGWTWAKNLGHRIIPPVPSLFTFNVTDPRIQDLEGLSLPDATVSIENESFQQRGAILITHWGLSGPAILKVSAWAARALYERQYQTNVRINWVSEREEPMFDRLAARRDGHPRNMMAADNFREVPRRLWSRFVDASGVPYGCRWAQTSNLHLQAMARQLTGSVFEVSDRGVFKDEFVTAGGVHLDDVDFRTLESKRCPGLYFAGEILDVDGETGGFNFQNAWTTGWIAGRSAANCSEDSRSDL